MQVTLITLLVLVFCTACSSKFVKENSPQVINFTPSTYDYKLNCKAEFKNDKTEKDCNNRIITEIKHCLEKTYSLAYNANSRNILNFNYEYSQLDSTSFPLAISFFTLGIVPIKTELFEESLRINYEEEKKTDTIKSKFLLEAGWYYYFQNLFSKKLDTCEKIKLVLTHTNK